MKHPMLFGIIIGPLLVWILGMALLLDPMWPIHAVQLGLQDMRNNYQHNLEKLK